MPKVVQASALARRQKAEPAIRCLPRLAKLPGDPYLEAIFLSETPPLWT